MSLALRFLSNNSKKLEEAQAILAPASITVIPLEWKVDELQVLDTEHLVRDKALKAFNIVRRPVFVEHTSLSLRHLNGFPGGLTQSFWDTLEAERFAELFGRSSDPSVVAETRVAYVDGRAIYTFRGTCSGTVTETPRGPRGFQWDCVFQPDGESETFAEMGVSRKNEISMRRVALEQFVMFLRTHHGF